MNAKMKATTVIKPQRAPTRWEPLTAPATVVLLEMESRVQVSSF